MKNNWPKALPGILLILIAIASQFIFTACSCDQQVHLVVMAGARTERDCVNMKEEALNGTLPDITYACVGDTITICWSGNVESNKLEPNLGSVGSQGMKQIVVTESMTIKLEPQNSCAASKEFKVQVIKEETPSVWDARWNTDATRGCNFLFFKISEFFMSPNILVVKAQANFQPGQATGSPCTFPSYITGKNTNFLGSSGFILNKPMEQVKLSIPAPAAGNWIFEFIDGQCKEKCKQDAVLPFELILDCNK